MFCNTIPMRIVGALACVSGHWSQRVYTLIERVLFFLVTYMKLQCYNRKVLVVVGRIFRYKREFFFESWRAGWYLWLYLSPKEGNIIGRSLWLTK